MGIRVYGALRKVLTMKVLVSGSSGLIGSALVNRLRRDGHEVVRLVRGAADAPDTVGWDPRAGTIDAAALDGVGGVVHLAGAPIAASRWSKRVKQQILASRVEGTRTLAEALARLLQPPRVLVSASGVGFYGDRGDEVLDEDGLGGTGFLAEVARQWEAATAAASAAGIRVVMMRLGVVLSASGGALPRMVLPFKFGAGGPVGSGRQYMSWITLDDAVSAMLYAVETDTLSGPVNTVAPSPVTNREFASVLGRVLRRPSVLPLPALAVKTLMGEMGVELLLASTRAVPGKLEASGFTFEHPELEDGLRHVLGQGER
jgi:uncharacterized protein (TIGR01777 family)